MRKDKGRKIKGKQAWEGERRGRENIQNTFEDGCLKDMPQKHTLYTSMKLSKKSPNNKKF